MSTLTDEEAYVYDGSRRVPGDVIKVKVAESVMTIDGETFQSQSSLISIMIPNSVTMIGKDAFLKCTSLTSIAIPDSVTRIDHGAFCHCESLTSIVISGSLTSIEAMVFNGCTSLTSILIPDSVTRIDNKAFSNCTSLTSITIPDSVATVGDGAFGNCTSLTIIKLSPNMTHLGRELFRGCSSLSSVTLPSRIRTLHSDVFTDCSSLISVCLPKSLTAISLSAFEGCPKLSAINASSFSTTTFANSPDKLKHLLIKAGFQHIHLDSILYGADDSDSTFDGSDMYYDTKVWGRKRNEDSGRLPLFTAAARCLTWGDMRLIFSVNMPAIQDIDEMTGLRVFMLAAAQPASDIESVYNLLREYPPALLPIINDCHPIASTGRIRIRTNDYDKFVRDKIQKV